jgi:fucose 4-O-acetylase-like acetyltransferase
VEWATIDQRMHLILLSLMVILPYLAIAVTGWVMGWSYVAWSIGPMLLIMVVGWSQMVRGGSPWWSAATLVSLCVAYLGGILLPVWAGLAIAGILVVAAICVTARQQWMTRRRIDELS